MLSDKFSQVISYNDLVTHFGDRGAINTPTTPTRSDSTMDAIKSYMLSHQLKQGDPLPTEATLCATLGVSRSSVREALRKLEALNIVEVQRGRGSFVGPMTLQPLVESLLLKNALAVSEGTKVIQNIAQTRISLDLGIADTVVTALKGTSNPELHALVEAMMKKTKQGLMFLDEDIAFHTGIVARIDNELISELMGAMWFVHQTLLPNLDLQSAATKENMMATARSHGEMLDAAENGDLDGYIAAVHRHYGPLQTILANAL